MQNLWIQVQGPWILLKCSLIQVHGSWIQVQDLWIRMKNSLIQVQGSWILEQEVGRQAPLGNHFVSEGSGHAGECTVSDDDHWLTCALGEQTSTRQPAHGW